MKDLLIVLGKRVQELRSAKSWSQEEFAHVSGLHRTYIGQIERGEKNISFGNLAKIAGVLGVSLSELLSTLEDGAPPGKGSQRKAKGGARRPDDAAHRLFEVQRQLRRLKHQRAEMDRTVETIEALTTIRNPPPSKR